MRIGGGVELKQSVEEGRAGVACIDGSRVVRVEDGTEEEETSPCIDW